VAIIDNLHMGDLNIGLQEEDESIVSS